MSTYTFPQNAKTNHPEVIASINETLRRESEMLEKARDISERYTGDRNKGWLSGRTFDHKGLSQIQVTKEQYEALPGRWKVRDTMGRTSPYANNTEAKGFHVGYKPEHIPGRGNILWGAGYMGTGTVFIHDGWAYSYLGFVPDISEKEFLEIEKFGWTEIVGSELHKALEDYNEALKENKA